MKTAIFVNQEQLACPYFNSFTAEKVLKKDSSVLCLWEFFLIF